MLSAQKTKNPALSRKHDSSSVAKFGITADSDFEALFDLLSIDKTDQHPLTPFSLRV